MFSTLGIDYTRQRLENATRRAERAAQHREASARRRWFGRGARPADVLQPAAAPAPACC